MIFQATISRRNRKDDSEIEPVVTGNARPASRLHHLVHNDVTQCLPVAPSPHHQLPIAHRRGQEQPGEALDRRGL